MHKGINTYTFESLSCTFGIAEALDVHRILRIHHECSENSLRFNRKLVPGTLVQSRIKFFKLTIQHFTELRYDQKNSQQGQNQSKCVDNIRKILSFRLLFVCEVRRGWRKEKKNNLIQKFGLRQIGKSTQLIPIEPTKVQYKWSRRTIRQNRVEADDILDWIWRPF